MNVDGSGLVRLTDNSFNDDHPRWSPNGTKILFQSDRDNLETGSRDIYVMNADGSGQTRLTYDVADDVSAVWSPDGSKMAFQSLRNGLYYQIYVMNADGTNQVNVSNGVSADSEPSWSPDGAKIAFASDRDHPGTPSVYVMNANGSNQVRLTLGSEPFRDEQPGWSPDGSRIAFVSTRDSIVETWQETDDDGGILVRTKVRSNKEIYLMNADGTNQTRLTNTLENDDSPAWSPEGTKLVFRSDRERECCDPADQIWMMNADGTSQTLVSNDVYGDFSPSWSAIVSDASPQYLGTTDYGNIIPSENLGAGDSTSLPVRITFDELANNTVVADQYLNQYGVRFSSGNFFYPVHTYQNCSAFCSTTSPPNFITTKPNDYGQVTIEFTQPASNLSFYIIGLDTLSGTFGRVDVYVNGSPSVSATYPLNGVFNTTSGFTLGSTANITKVIIYNSSDAAGFGLDDVTFSIPSDVKITNARVSGFLNGTTQNALAGADFALNAIATPGGFAGGSFSWTFTGPYAVIGGAINSSSVTIRSTNVGTLMANVSYVKNGVSVSGSVTIIAILPTLNSFTTQVATDRITRDQHCGGLPPAFLGARYTLGCYQAGGPDDGIVFTAVAQIPAGPYLSNPAQSGIKIKQLVSQFRKRINDTGNGNIECASVRGSQDQEDTGWQLDGYEAMTYFVHTPPTFAQGNTLTYSAFDAPGESLDSTAFGIFSMNDVVFADDRFQTFVYYYVGNPLVPTFQKPLRLTSENTFNYSFISWKWNGQAIFDWTNPLKYRLQFSNTPSISLGRANTLPTLHGNALDVRYGRCPGDPAPSMNKIDGARCFVNQHYWDFLNRAPDQSGWDYWLNEIAQCAFDINCKNYRRIQVAKAFFFSGDFIATDPDMANPPGTPNFNPAVYNRAFVRHCYENFLRRQPEAAGWDYWTGVLDSNGDYNQIINAFILAGEYRDRLFPFPGTQPCPTCFHECP